MIWWIRKFFWGIWYRHVYLTSPYWQMIRRQAMKYAHNKCQCSEPGHSKVLDVHHLHYKDLWHEVIGKDLIVLCRRHHQDTHHGKYLHLTGGEMLYPYGNPGAAVYDPKHRVYGRH